MQDPVRASNGGKRVIVVGGGGGGLCAAIAAADAGAERVILLEKLSHLGGDTALSDQIISGAGTELQKKGGVADTPHQYLIDLLKGGRYRSDLVLAATLVQNAPAAWDWLAARGCQFPGPEALHVQHDHSAARSVRLLKPGMIVPLKQAAEERGVEIHLNTPVKELLVEDGAVVGVKAESEGLAVEYRAGSVILATGGFGRNAQMVKETCPALAEAVSWSAAGNTGDGIRMAEALDAEVISYPDMPLDGFRVIQCGADVRLKVLHPTYILAQARQLGGIMVGCDGQRFYDEMGRSYEFVLASMQRGSHYFLVFDARIASPSRWLPEKTFEEQLDTAAKDGLVFATAPTLAELAGKMDVPAAALAETVARWNQDVADGKDSQFGRSEALGTIEQPPFYALRYKPAIVQTLGGLRIDPQARVIAKTGRPIAGLFAVGQVTGGIHGADYIGGSSLLELAVFGKIAGEQAAI